MGENGGEGGERTLPVVCDLHEASVKGLYYIVVSTVEMKISLSLSLSLSFCR